MKTKIKTRKIMVRANSVAQAKLFGKSHGKVYGKGFLPEKIVSVKLNKRVGLAGGIKGYTITFRQKEDLRPRRKDGLLYKSYQGRKPRL